MNELLNLVDELRRRIGKYGNLLRGSEALTRYVLIDPVLRALGWDIENPDIVRPEEMQKGGKPDYTLYFNGQALITLEAKKLGSRLDENTSINTLFQYGWKNDIPYFIITDGNVWKIYSTNKPGGALIEVNILKDSKEDVVRKLLSLWKPLIRDKIVIIDDPIKRPIKISLREVKKFYSSLTANGKVLLRILFEAWKENRELSEDEIISKLKKKGVNIDGRKFAGIRSGITRRSKKMEMRLPPPIEEIEYGEGKRYKLRNEWYQVLKEIPPFK